MGFRGSRVQIPPSRLGGSSLTRAGRCGAFSSLNDPLYVHQGVWRIGESGRRSSRTANQTPTAPGLRLPARRLLAPPFFGRPRWASGALAESRSTHFTRTGLSRSVVVPSPSSPAALYPQQYAAPPVVTPQV